MPKNDTIQGILARERRDRLWERRVLGYPVWGLERLLRYRRELLGVEARLDVERASAVVAAWRRFSGPLQRSVASLSPRLLEKLRSRDLWVFSSASYRRANEHGERVCIFAEHLRAELGERLLFLEYDSAGFGSAVTDDVLPIDAPMLAALGGGEALGRLLGKTIDRSTREAFTPTSARHLIRSAVYGRTMFEATRRLLRHVAPRAVFVLNAYQYFTPMLRAVKQAGIPVIELQHGVIHESHPGYVHEHTPDYLPDHLVVFGEHFGELLDRETPVWRHRWSVGGHPWMARVLSRQSAEPARDAVVLFSQNDPPVIEQLLSWMGPLRARLPAHVRLVIKPHPREHDPERTWGSVLAPGIELASHRDDTYALLNQCVVAATLYSTVAVEALAYPCRSAVIECPYWNEDIRALVDAGHLTAVSSPEQLAALATEPIGSAASDVPVRLFGIGAPPLSFTDLLDRVEPRPREQSGDTP
jgi:hypothetical protein